MTTNTSGRFAGEVAFVTGAGNGIGRAPAIAFARQGASVVAADLSEGNTRGTVRRSSGSADRSSGSAATSQIATRSPQRCSARSSRSARSISPSTTQAFALLTGATADIAEDEWDRAIDTNLRGVFLCMKHEIPLMLEHGGGAIVNTSSGAGIRGFARGAASGASKFGVIGLTKCGALDCAASGIRIDAICPGVIDTEMIRRLVDDSDERRDAFIRQEPVGRLGNVDEIAAAVLWLCSDDATFTIGHALVVDGGQTVWSRGVRAHPRRRT